MRIICMVAAACVIAGPAWAQGTASQTGQPAPGAASPAATTAPPAVAEQADRLLRQMGEYVGSAEQFTFHADITFDHVLQVKEKDIKKNKKEK